MFFVSRRSPEHGRPMPSVQNDIEPMSSCRRARPSDGFRSFAWTRRPKRSFPDVCLDILYRRFAVRDRIRRRRSRVDGRGRQRPKDVVAPNSGGRPVGTARPVPPIRSSGRRWRGDNTRYCRRTEPVRRRNTERAVTNYARSCCGRDGGLRNLLFSFPRRREQNKKIITTITAAASRYRPERNGFGVASFLFVFMTVFVTVFTPIHSVVVVRVPSTRGPACTRTLRTRPHRQT